MKKVFFVTFCLLALFGCGSNPARQSYEESDIEKVDNNSKEMLNVRMGVAYFERGDYDTALDKLKKALRYNPKLAIAHSAIATVYQTMNATIEAERHYKLSVKYAPSDPTILNNYGTYLCQKGEYIEAVKYYRRTIANPFYKTPETAHENAGVCLVRGGQHDQAEEHLRKALSINPKLPISLYNMVIISAAKNNNMKARAFLQRLQSVAKLDEHMLKVGYEIETKIGNKKAANYYLTQLRQVKN